MAALYTSSSCAQYRESHDRGAYPDTRRMARKALMSPAEVLKSCWPWLRAYFFVSGTMCSITSFLKKRSNCPVGVKSSIRKSVLEVCQAASSLLRSTFFTFLSSGLRHLIVLFEVVGQSSWSSDNPIRPMVPPKSRNSASASIVSWWGGRLSTDTSPVSSSPLWASELFQSPGRLM